MRIRGKLFGILGVVLLDVLLLVGLLFFMMAEMERFQTTAERGLSLIDRSRTTMDYLKDLAISAFAPDAYRTLKDVIYFENFSSSLQEWENSLDDFQKSFLDFMNDETVRRLARSDRLTMDEYTTAFTMSRKAFEQIETAQTGFHKLKASGLVPGDQSYHLVLSSGDSDLYGLIGQVRTMSFYLENNFESFLHHFVTSINVRISETRSRLNNLFFILTAWLILLSFALAFGFGNRIVKRIRSLEGAMKRIAQGDFSVRLALPTRDELGDLARNINTLSDELKRRIQAFLHVTHDVGHAIAPDLDLETVRRLVTETVLRDTRAKGAVYFPSEKEDETGDPIVALGFFEDNETVTARIRDFLDDQKPFLWQSDLPYGVSSLMSGPLLSGGKHFGHLVAGTIASDETFNDLDFTVFQAYTEYAALAIDHYIKYRELVERREAEYQSLQARIQPHFLYNVLNGLVGLNRMGDSKGLEAAVFALKDLLRYTLDGGREVGLGEELSFLRRYLDLQKLRFQERFDFTLSCEPGLTAFPIPKLLLQPLVENAVIHGVEPMEAKGYVEVTAKSESKRGRTFAVITVRDNGAGFFPDAVDLNRSIGVSNVKRRLELAFPGSSLSFVSAPGAGCEATLLILKGGGWL